MNHPHQHPSAGSSTMTADLLKLDAANREKALDAKQSFIIEAPAGAGKTELLTQRFLALLAKVNEPEEIVALTFTNKAAAEMRHRVVSSLRQSATGILPEASHKQITYQLGLDVLKRDKDRQWHLLDHAGRLQITTLDALCGRLARQMPLLSRFGSQPGIAANADAHYAQAAMATFQSMEDDNSDSQAIARVLDYFDNDAGKFQSMIVAMLASRDQWLRHSTTAIDLKAAESALANLVEDELAKVAEHLSPGAQAELMPIARFAASNALLAQAQNTLTDEFCQVGLLETWLQPLQPTADDLPLWQGLSQLLLTKTGSIRSQLPAILGFGTPEGKALGKTFKALLAELKENAASADALGLIRKLPSPLYQEAEERLISDLMTVLRVARGHLWLIFKEAREVDFTEMGQNALQALGSEEDPSDLQLRLDYRISHLLVDEFQDTSPTQVDLLKKLTAGWSPDSGRTLFLVGDPMQSIYKFRKADVGLFLKVRDKGLGDIQLTSLNLYRNNRSHQEVVTWCNEVFPDVFSKKDDHHRGAVEFKSAQATKGPHPQARIQWHPVIDTRSNSDDGEDDAGGPADEREALEVIRVVRQAQAEDPQGTIAILVRARSHLETLVNVLKSQQQPLLYQAVEIEGLANRQVIQDLLSLTHALVHKGDRTHWLAVLRAPWCGLLLSDLHRLAADDHHATVWSLMNDNGRVQALSPDGQIRLMHVRQVMDEAFAHQGRQRIKRWVESVWHGLGGPNCLTSEGDLLDASAYFAALDQLDERGHVDLNRLRAEVDMLFAAPDPTAPPQLQIMTIHKSKGLEFDTVIMPGLHKKSPPADKKLLLWDEVIGPDGHEQLIVAPIQLNRKATTNEASKFDFLHQFEGERSRNETQRLLYVAITRSKRQIHLLGCAKTDADLALKEPAKDSFLALLWHVGQTHFEQALQVCLDKSSDESNPKTTTIDPATFNHRLIRLKEAKRPEIFAANTELLFDQKELQNLETQEGEAVHAGQIAADIGTLVHKYLEIIANTGLSAWPVSRILSLEPAMTRWMRQQGHATGLAATAVQEVIYNLVTTLQSEDGKWVLGKHEDAGCEVSFTTARNGVFQTHIIDRTFVENGVRWIVDYKTTRQALKTEDDWAVYRAQLDRYRSLFGADKEIKCAIFLCHQGTIVTMPT